MPKKENIETVLKCAECGEFLHTRVVGEVINHEGKDVRRYKTEVFCPMCKTSNRIFNHYKKQRDDEQKKGAQVSNK